MNNSIEPTCYDKIFSCNVCNKFFKSKYSLRKHQLIHSGEKPYQCDECEMKFRDPSTLRKHKLTHSGEKRHSCNECEMKFTHSGNLKSHKLTHSGEKPYSCDECKMKFNRSGSLRRHKLIHSGEKPYSCNECDMKFTHSGTLKTHKMTHSGEKPYSCDECEMKCTTSSGLKTHRLTHSGEKPYSCDKCDAKFRQSGGLSRHKENWHTKEGMNRKKIQEQRVRNVLKSNNFIVDEQIHMRYQQGCVPDSDKYCAFIDFHITNVVKSITLVECNEYAHDSYPIACELTRYEQIHESLSKAGYTLPVVFILYNPNGPVEIDEVKVKISRKEREMILVNLLQDIIQGKIDFSKPLNLIYLFYSIKNNIPKICMDDEYNKQMFHCVNFELSLMGIPIKRS